MRTVAFVRLRHILIFVTGYYCLDYLAKKLCSMALIIRIFPLLQVHTTHALATNPDRLGNQLYKLRWLRGCYRGI